MSSPTHDPANANRITVLLVDDHRMMREGLRGLIRKQSDMTVVGEAGDAETALECLRAHRPQAIVMDVHLAGTDGVELSRGILKEYPDIRIVVLSGDEEPSAINRAFAAGVNAYVSKTDATSELIRALRLAVAGKNFLSPSLNTRVIEDIVRNRRGEAAKPGPARLTDRELQLLRLVTEGRSSSEIASALDIGIKSVDTYRSRLMKKLHCANVVELTRYAIREGLSPL